MPDLEKLRTATQTASRLFNEGQLSPEKLDELERQAEEAAGDLDDWREPFIQYRAALEQFGALED